MAQENKKTIEINIDGEITQIIVVETNNKNSYCKFVDGFFTVTLGKFHSEKDVLDIVKKLFKKINIDKESKPSLEIDAENKKFRLFGDLYFFTINEETKIINIFNENTNEVVFSTKLRLFNQRFIKSTIQDKFIEKKLFDKLAMLQKKWEEKTNLGDHTIKIVKKKTSWASNSIRTKTITYNFFLHNFSEEIIESVVIHELVHDLYRNHSVNFYNCLLKYCPKYKMLHQKNQKHIFK